MAGVPEAMCAAQELNGLAIPGVEISSEVKGDENLHILGYFYHGSNSVALEKQLEKIREGRHQRGKEILTKPVRFGTIFAFLLPLHQLDVILIDASFQASMDVHLEWERVFEIAGEATPGDRALVEADYVSKFKEPFVLCLGNDGPAYVEHDIGDVNIDRFRVHFPPDEVIKLIESARIRARLFQNLLGWDFSISPYADKIEAYEKLADESAPLKLGGSDFHGINPDTEQIPGDIPFPTSNVDAFQQDVRSVWETPLCLDREKVAARVQSDPERAHKKENLLIWRKQLDFALEVAGTLPNTEVTIQDHSVGSRYCVIVVNAH
ncbi:TPA: hypothetical protein N0F65_000097 [Lagenidium giganteum]|uniref:Uncharacterized protein n=1 Tax=Lagenidium giganteum TaxID=4803 RepID=A0AAV2YQY1_9STRA|nr:TPA: hypothetical protein N0F65_000097 [Lagenidium giganteum]